MIKLSPSALACDFSALGEQIKKVEDAKVEYIHLDVMDGVFVPNLSFGPVVISSIREKSKLVFDVHLMIVDPVRYIEAFARAGADILTFHYESCENRDEVIDLIHSFGIRAAMSIKPKTSPSVLKPYLDKLDMILIMSVEPGYGGQKLIPETLDNVEEAAALIRAAGREKETELEVDGGITLDNVGQVVSRGANVIVAGSSIFGHGDIADRVRQFRRVIQEEKPRR